MNYPFYSNSQENCPQTPVELPPAISLLKTGIHQQDKNYLPNQGLVDAVNAALLLQQPLLLTGEAGTGKTQLAYHVACQLGYKVLKFETKSTSTAQNLFYSYDALARFQAEKLEGKGFKKTQEFLTFHALGLAILLAQGIESAKEFLPSTFEDSVRRLLGEDVDFNKPQRCIVLIDEIDKAPRDFPNDILNEVEKSYFRIPELGALGNVAIEAPTDKKPILILTSNSEKSLPDAFLRRCIYYDIPFPNKEHLKEIVEIRLSEQLDDIKDFLSEALDIFLTLRAEKSKLRKKPSTAELLNWLLLLREMFKGGNPFENIEQIQRSLSPLIKTKEDVKKASQALGITN